ncbi:dicarboxylate/amino acid:cation symporter [Paludibacterium purpuratum]|uniref:Na+/H+-dicarboxylate symporter n=1 Tax=Paludibacterium purpuratum TaxID=1144873 RepID=A0A4R7B969_9NEIS|nr:dicarboxylate/amino acid:cation symporter [Paludibacterium purpuratum]TDR81420.1 Na+/H+-dicarboxylate symporter [Paludibacterium purpuratum]
MAIHARKFLPPWAVILLSMVLGVAAGMVLGEDAARLQPLGDLFVALIRMVVMPVIFVSLVCAVTSLHDLTRMRRIACKALAIYCGTMMLSAALTMSLAEAFDIGRGLSYARQAEVPGAAMDWSYLMPANPVQAMAQGQVMPVMLFALLFGIAINLSGEAGRPVAHFFESLNHVIFRLVGMLLRYAPIGVFALMAAVSATCGLDMLSQLGALVGTLYLACLLMLTVVYGTLLGLAGLNPLPFMTKMIPVQLFAFSSCSSNASLPMTLETANRLGVPRAISAFVLPLGSTVNMNGLAIYLGAVAIFAANAAGVELSWMQKAMVMLTVTFGALGAAGMPGTGLIVMSLVLTSVGLPLEVIAAVAAVDRIIDMINTSTNVSGDALAAVLVAKSEADFDREAYSA